MKRISNVLLHIFQLKKWPKTNSLFVRNCGFLSWNRIYFQGCQGWSMQFTNYIPALSLEKNNVRISKEREKRVD